MVSRPGSPGPAPTKYTFPGGWFFSDKSQTLLVYCLILDRSDKFRVQLGDGDLFNKLLFCHLVDRI